ncbi:hypothetical protein FACS1894151_10440 [Spirochaetia bacterium]|nr:hypothetical protein FACS1894151_10440 [Spirochaetia bacterium]
MKKKWMLHIIAVMALGIYTGLGLASAASTPTADGSPQTGGRLYIKNTSNYVTFCAMVGNITPPTTREILPNRESNAYFIDKDGTYTVYYKEAEYDNNGRLILIDPASHALHSKSVHISGGERVNLNIP